jgi:hypothetical protein
VQPSEGSLGWGRISAIALGGVALVGGIAGAGLAASAASTYGDSDPFWTDDVCEQKGLEIRQDAFGKATGADVAFAVAGVAAAGAVVLWIVAPGEPGDSTMRTAVGLGSVTVQGVW